MNSSYPNFINGVPNQKTPHEKGQRPDILVSKGFNPWIYDVEWLFVFG
ncbi:hypothetical protein SAMN05444412_1233 [Rhodonellum ikkaensis]|uniref:Uncharacterized protein n=1 Tax=Rhodonellum ikkaensis TaxID=336829 RepID=A0A1H3TY08_9BACT|nr:hypothetical protein SAMN05444412_1233 [Rhodonellum ikkaensis]